MSSALVLDSTLPPQLFLFLVIKTSPKFLSNWQTPGTQNTSIHIASTSSADAPPAATPTPEGFRAASDPGVKSRTPSRFLSHAHHCKSQQQQVDWDLKAAKPKPSPGNSAAAQGSPPALLPNIFPMQLPLHLLGAMQLAKGHTAKWVQ